jgi:hypothetical protein
VAGQLQPFRFDCDVADGCNLAVWQKNVLLADCNGLPQYLTTPLTLGSFRPNLTLGRWQAAASACFAADEQAPKWEENIQDLGAKLDQF